ncbi:MAG: hypothetical protein DSY80_00970, partial [Desulfocapsa sp.]
MKGYRPDRNETYLSGQRLSKLLPFVMGKAICGFSKKESVSPLWSYINSSCVILIVYASTASSHSAFTGLTAGDFILIFLSVALVHLLLL